ncbi:MAG: SufD family Fe-S cluster assembly protein, partial [Dehalococcoidia bacterium]
RLSKIHSETRMVGPGTRSEMLGLLFGEKRQHFDHYTLQDHRAPNTSSDLLYRSVLKDRARYVYYGFIKMRKEAQQSQGYQTDRNLLLTGRARADSIPVLEIEADDVKCSHASATGPVDDDQLFYLMSRGLPRLEAERMLVEGFLEPVVAKVPLPWLREKLAYTIQSKLKDQ